MDSQKTSQNPSTCLILNPNAGKGRAARRVQKSLEILGKNWDVWHTERPGHGRELASKAALQGFQRVVAAGGDGTVHEAACGLVDAHSATPDLQCRLAVLPIGSANDFAWSMKAQGLTQPTRVDVGKVSALNGKFDYFLECIGMGLSGCVTIESRKIKWLQGPMLYSLATVFALMRFSPQPFEIEIDGETFNDPTLLASFMLGRREGSFVFAHEAQLDDGHFDLVHAHHFGVLGAMTLLPRIALWGAPRKHSRIRTKRCQSAVIRCERDIVIHTDGELFSVPGDGVHEVKVEVIPQHLEVELLEVHSMVHQK